jgi:hypothetical protein
VVIGICVDDPNATFSEIATGYAVRNWPGLAGPQLDVPFSHQPVILGLEVRRPAMQELERQALLLYAVSVLSFLRAAFARRTCVRGYVFHQSQTRNQWMERSGSPPSGLGRYKR